MHKEIDVFFTKKLTLYQVSKKLKFTTKETEWAPAVSSASGYVLDVTEDAVGQIAQIELFEPEEVTEVAQQAFVGAEVK